MEVMVKMQTMVELPEETAREVDRLGRQFGFKDEREFIKDAVNEKILQLKKRLFISATDEVRRELERKEISIEEILGDFERSRG
jgi:metal-responsive CopG/Arc/MetJ family transcriptional regulator